MKLPPIAESSSVPQASTSPRSSKTSKTLDNESVSRRKHRISVSSSNSSLSTSTESLTTIKPPPLFPKQRRTSFDHRRRGSSIDLTKSEEIMKKLQQRKKSSVLNIMPDGRRASLGSIGARVTTLLKAKNAFSMLAKKRKSTKDETTEDQEKETEIEELPPAPRFASTLSAEAQYAVMKGYEDVVHGYLCRQYPEYRPVIRRNQTPHTGIIVKSMKERLGKKFAPEATKISEDTFERNNSPDDTVVDTVDAEEPVSSSTPKPDNNLATCLQQAFNSSSVHHLIKKNQSKRALQNFSLFQKRSSNGSDIKTVPEVVQDKERQLVMTYRYQSVMDILDSLREHQGMHPLSPRKKEDRQIEPVKDFNSWSRVWTREFEPKICMKTL